MLRTFTDLFAQKTKKIKNMTHQTTRRSTPAPTNVECPLASLGRINTTAIETINDVHHHQAIYQHPLSSSPLDPKVYQMSRKSSDLNTEADDTAHTTSNEIEAAQVDTMDGLRTFLNSQKLQENINESLQTFKERHSAQLYNSSRSSSRSSLERTSLQKCPRQQQQQQQEQAGCIFEVRERSHNLNYLQSNSRILEQHPHPGNQEKSFLALHGPMQRRRQEDGSSNIYTIQNNFKDVHNVKDVNSNGEKVPSNSFTIHQKEVCDAPAITPFYLDKKMDEMYLSSAIRNLPLGSEADTYQSETYYLEDGLRSISNFGHDNEGLQENNQSLGAQQSPSSSEINASDCNFLNPRNSPLNVFNSCNGLSVYPNVNNSSTNNNPSSSHTNFDQRFYHSKIQNLSDGLSNLGRFSPSLDQGYATLVSPSPTGHHSNIITTHGIVHHPPPESVSIAAVTAQARRRIEKEPPPWKKKIIYQSGPYFERLSDDTILKIFNWLDSCELCNISRVCRRFDQLAWRPVLWREISLTGEHLNGDKTLKMIFRQLCGHTCNGLCPDVERVMLSFGCKITDKGLTMLMRRCPELTHLQLQNCVRISNQALENILVKCTNIQHLDLTGCSQLTTIAPNSHLETSGRLPLQYLDLTDCVGIDDVALKIIVKNFTQLVYLYLRRCIQITDAGLKFVPSFCIALRELSVSDCKNVTDFGIYELAKLGPALRYLSVAKCDRVSDAGLKVIARRCYKLRYLNARGCEAVSDDSITVLARLCPRLRALDIGKCDVSDAGLRALAECCPNLKKLSLRNCDMITDHGIQCIAYYCRGLQQLNIQDCQISIEGYRAVKKYCKRCVIEHTNPGFC